ncbi:3009_t:CDS:1, partial [Paraglomus brasilianum]
LGYGEASVFYGKLWSRATSTLKTELTRLGDIVKSKLKENPAVFIYYNRDDISSTADSMTDNIIDANGIITDESFRTNLEFSKNANVNFHIDGENFIDHTNSIDYPTPANCENSGYINTHVNPNIAVVDTCNFHNDDTLTYKHGTVAENVDTAHFADGASGNFAYDNAFTLYSGGGDGW